MKGLALGFISAITLMSAIYAGVCQYTETPLPAINKEGKAWH